MSLPYIQLLGLRVNSLTSAEVILACRDAIRERTPRFLVTLNALGAVEASRNPAFRHALAQASLIVPDGMGIMLSAWWNGTPLKARVTGLELLDHLFHWGEYVPAKIFLYGSRPQVIAAAGAAIHRNFPSVSLVGWIDGYRPQAEVMKAIQDAKPDVLLVGLGQPAQELWLAQHLVTLGVPVGIGVGGCFDVLGGALPRAPRWLQLIGLEWLYRALREPKRFLRLLKLPLFLWLVLTDPRATR